MDNPVLEWREGEEQCAELEWEGRFSGNGKYIYTKYELELENVYIDKKLF